MQLVAKLVNAFHTDYTNFYGFLFVLIRVNSCNSCRIYSNPN